MIYRVPDKAGHGYRFDCHGWIYVHIEGDPYERGFQHGYLIAPELQEILNGLDYLTYWKTGMKWEFFVAAAEKLFVPHIDQEFMDEIRGVAAGAQAAGINVNWQEILAWNGHMELLEYWWPHEKKTRLNAGRCQGDTRAEPGVRSEHDHCSAFIATGRATRQEVAVPGAPAGAEYQPRIVMAHNSWDEFVNVQSFNMIVDSIPASGYRLFMQTAPGLIDSFTDFFITSAGLMGTETTISGFDCYDPDGAPEFYRVRKAMQYAGNLDRFVQIMAENNNGGYANSWLLGDVHSGEIMMFELGLCYSNVERKNDGYFTGFNGPQDPRIRNLECGGIACTDIRDAIGARRVRLTQLLEQHHGKVDLNVAKLIISDHHDVYLKRNNPCSRTICSHCDLDSREHQPGRPAPFAPQGAVDGKVTDSDLAANLSFWGRWGNSCGTPFYADGFLAEHAQWNHQKGYLRDRPSQPWAFFMAGMENGF